MPNHLHFIARSLIDDSGLDGIIRDFKRHTTKQVIHQLQSDNELVVIEKLKKSKLKKEVFRNAVVAKGKLSASHREHVVL